jgi:hypothetical protein
VSDVPNERVQKESNRRARAFLLATYRRGARVDRLDGEVALDFLRDVIFACTFPRSAVHRVGLVERDVRVSTGKQLGGLFVAVPDRNFLATCRRTLGA